MSQTVSASGTLAPADTEDLSFSASGTVTAVNAKAGQKVVKGQVLATIDSASLASAVVQAEAQVTADQSTLDDDDANGASSAQLTADRATLASDQAQLASARTALAGASLTSPIDGVVSTVSLTVGQQLGSSGASGNTPSGSDSGAGPTVPDASSSDASSAQITVVSTKLVVNLDVDDTQISQLKVGQSATVSPSSASSSGRNGFGGLGTFSFGGFGNRAANPSANQSSNSSTGNSTTTNTPTTSTTAKVTSVGAIASASSGVATFPVAVTVTGATTGLYSGATAQATITYHELQNAIQVPTLAVTQSNGQSYVTVSTNGKTVKRAVTTGITSGGEVQITSGLKTGEEVVVATPAATRGSGNGSNNSGTGGTFTPPGGGNFTPPGGGEFGK
jgi:multidrug efflux pump subunit AcrA (membrane-fusion protein)